MADPWTPLAPPYGTIVVDPPWPQHGGGPLVGREGFGDATGDSKPLPYQTMTVPEIAALGVGELAAPVCHLYLWTTSGFLAQAFGVLEAWGFRYSTTLVWAKAPMGGGLGGAYGIATEFVLFGWRGRAAARARVPRNWFSWPRPYDSRGKPQHSAKPSEFLGMVEQVSPAPFCELFARRARAGWDGWGDQYPAAPDVDAPVGVGGQLRLV